MPPNSRQRRALSYETPSLSDEDVGLLYQIITHAEGKPGAQHTPFRALFEAYDEVIEEHAVDADPGHVCLHFLFKMGSKGVKGETLYDKFESLLQRMGIVLELDADDGNNTTAIGDSGTLTREINQPRGLGLINGIGGSGHNGGGRTLDKQDDSTAQTMRGRRRASFNSMYDVGDDPTQRSFANRPSSRSSLSRLQTGKPEFHEPSPPPEYDATEGKTVGSPNRTQLIAQFLDVGRRLISRFDSLRRNNDAAGDETQLSTGAQAKSAVHRDRSARMAGASRPRPRDSMGSSGSDDGEDDDDDESISFQGDNVIYQEQQLPENFYRPSLSDLLRDASTFNMYRQRAIHRRLLTQWLKKAIQIQQSSRNMGIVAVNRDRSTLLRQAFETWRGIIQDKRQTVRTERFFKHLERRAGRARDLFLLTKAFTHWAQVASDEVAKASAARRRVLGVKYFNAWREITAVNELKSQRFVLRRPFNAWRKRTQQIREAEATAGAGHDKQLTHGMYWQLFWAFCDRRAPQWYEFRLKRRSLLCWLRSFRANRERDHDIDARNRRSAVESAWQAWSQRSKAVSGAEKDAASIQRRKLLKESVEEWKIQAHYAPVAFRVSDMLDRRVLQSAFAQWVLRAEMVKQAREFDRHRLVHNFWTTWNDLLRCQALGARINERLKMEAMYKWILAERFRLMQRIRDQRIKHDTFSTFVASIRGTYSRLLHNADIHEDYRNEELLRAKFNHWRDQLVLQRQREYIAFEFYTPRLQQESLVAWRSKKENVKKWEARAHDARYYFLATRTIKQWRIATQQSAKRRRQDAYAMIRRRIKINATTKALCSWVSWAAHYADLEREAIEFHRNKSLKIATELFVRWYDQAAKRVEDCHEAQMHYIRQAGYAQLLRWVELYYENRDLEEQASGMYHVHVLGQANAGLRRLGLRVFQIKSNFETADSLRERTIRQHSRGMFRNWIEKARIKLEERDSFAPLITPGPSRTFDGAPSFQPASASSRPAYDPFYPNESPFKLSEFLNSEQPLASASVPGAAVASPLTLATPNYMASPSKRAARAKTLAQQGSTTPATPLRTPFAGRLFRAANAGGPASNRRRSALGNSVRFVDDEPTSPSEGRRSGRRVGS